MNVHPREFNFGPEEENAQQLLESSAAAAEAATLAAATATDKAAEAEASALAISSAVLSYDTRVLLKAVDTSSETVAYLGEPGRAGLRRWNSTVLISVHQQDSNEWRYIAPNPAADGAWVYAETWHTQKVLLGADFQPEDSQVARYQTMLDSIAARHPDLIRARINGDIIDRASESNTGAAPPYGFAEFIADWNSRLPIPWGNSRFIPGNHDRDGIGAGSHPRAWSYHSYRTNIGSEYWAEKQGNLLEIGLGDMAGSTGGEISPNVIAAAKKLISRHQSSNIFIHLHQPLSGTYQGVTAVSNADFVQYNSALLEDMLTASPNIVAVFYGHVGNNHQFNDETHFGTRHIQIGTHIPSNVNDGVNDQYYVYNMDHGASSIDIQQWDSATDSLLSTKTLNLAYPLRLSPMVEDLTHELPAQTARSVQLSVSDYRVGNTLPADLNIAVTDDWVVDNAIDNMLNGNRVTYKLKFPGDGNINPVDSNTIAAPNGGVAGEVFFGYEKTNDVDSSTDVDFIIQLLENGLPVEALRVYSTGGVKADFVSDWVAVDVNTRDAEVFHGLGTDDFEVTMQIIPTGETRIRDSYSLWDRNSGERYGLTVHHDSTKLYLSSQNDGIYAEDNHEGGSTQYYTSGTVRLICRKY